jgi:UMF1 family MFS transporter
MLGCGWIGALACVAMVLVGRTAWQLGAALFAVAFLGYSCSIVVSYALLVDLSTAEDRDRASSVGWGIAYLGGAIPLAADFALSLAVDKSTLARIAMCTAGLWWIGFSVPVRRWLPERIGVGASGTPGGGSVLSSGFRQLAATLRHLRGFPLTLAFLGAFLIYNDGIQTVITVSAQYGDKELRLSDTVLLSGILLVQFVAYVGAVGLGRLAEYFGAKRVVLGSLVVWPCWSVQLGGFAAPRWGRHGGRSPVRRGRVRRRPQAAGAHPVEPCSRVARYNVLRGRVIEALA